MTPPLQQRAINTVPRAKAQDMAPNTSGSQKMKKEKSGKRAVDDYIDLTNSDEEELSYPKRKAARTDSNQNSQLRETYLQEPYVIGDSEDDDEIQFIASQARPDDTPRELYGVMISKVVGLQYYRGLASTGETVLLAR